MDDRDGVWQCLVESRERAIRVARARGAAPDEVDDIVQEAMVRVAGMPRVDTDRIGPLLTVVVANLVTDRHRARSRARRLEQRLAAGADICPAPEEAVCDAAEARWLLSRTAQLNERDRRALEMRMAGLSVGAAADALGVTYKAAEHALGRARARLRELAKATAGMLPVLLGRRRWAGRPPATVAVAAAVIVGVAAAPWHAAAAPPPAADGRTEQAARYVAQAEVLPLRARARTRTPRPAAEVVRARAAARGPAERIVVAGPVTAGGVRYGGAHVDSQHDEETFAETVQRCLRKGLAVTPDGVECAD